MKLELLEELGLSQGQIAVYRAVLELGTSGLNGIQEKTGIERRNIYDILNKLIERGLISYTVEKGRRTYQCTHPRTLSEQIKERQERLKMLNEQLPDVQKLFSEAKPGIRAEVFRGDEGIKTIFEEVLEYSCCHVLGGNSFKGYVVSKSLQRWFKHWMDRRVKQKHVMYDLVDYGTFLKEQPPEEDSEKSYYHYAQLPPDLRSPMVVLIYGDKVAQILWGQQSFAFVLESEEIRESFMRYFHYFWPKK